MGKTIMNPEGLPTPRGSYSLVNIAQPGRMVFIAGQTASDPQGNVVGSATLAPRRATLSRKSNEPLRLRAGRSTTLSP
jgi:enamine deaminase RidA (YjgF/YER057c/UK114 family)